MSKKDLSEREICTRYIYPALVEAGWIAQQIREEVTFTKGQIMVRGILHILGKTKLAEIIL